MKVKQLLENKKSSGYHVDIENETLTNTDYRRVLYTTQNTQLVLMNLQPGEDIGGETHNGSQFIRFEQGIGIVAMDDEEYNVKDGSAVVIPSGVKHNVINIGDEEMKLYALYSPPEHNEGTIDKEKPGNNE